MIQWSNKVPVYLYRDRVDFRKSINGLSLVIEESMGLSPLEPGLFVFCNRGRDKLKALYWDRTGFALWYKRLENDRFKWPRTADTSVLSLTHEQWDWLLRGLDMMTIKPHTPCHFTGVN